MHRCVQEQLKCTRQAHDAISAVNPQANNVATATNILNNIVLIFTQTNTHRKLLFGIRLRETKNINLLKYTDRNLHIQIKGIQQINQAASMRATQADCVRSCHAQGRNQYSLPEYSLNTTRPHQSRAS